MSVMVTKDRCITLLELVIRSKLCRFVGCVLVIKQHETVKEDKKQSDEEGSKGNGGSI